MTLNRMGSTRRTINRKTWVTGTLTLGAVAASGVVASAALHKSEPQKINLASQSSEQKSAGYAPAPAATVTVTANAAPAKGPVCLRLDSDSRKAVRKADSAAKRTSTIYVQLNKVEVLPCPKAGAPKPGGPVTTPAPSRTTPAPVRTTTPAPVRTTTPPPAPKPSTPQVTSTAS